MIDELQPNEVFVFGSNMSGHHAGGAARQAYEQFGAEWGVGEGLTGKCYAFPTLDENFQRVSNTQLKAARLNLYKTAEAHPELTFLLTKVGCGIAGFPESKMAGLFRNAPANIVRPADWVISKTPRKSRTEIEMRKFERSLKSVRSSDEVRRNCPHTSTHVVDIPPTEINGQAIEGGREERCDTCGTLVRVLE